MVPAFSANWRIRLVKHGAKKGKNYIFSYFIARNINNYLKIP